MNETDEIFRDLKNKKRIFETELSEKQKELQSLSCERQNIIIKKIHGELYYYAQWRQDGKVKSKYLSAVIPGVIADKEKEQCMQKELEDRIRELETSIGHLDRMLTYYEKCRKKEKLLDTFSFEVYWKDEITARVYVKEREIIVSRFSENPAKQLFAEKKMTRHQLGKIFELRCPDRGRPDIDKLLQGMGLSEYDPYEIVRKTHGVSFNDYIWFRFPGEKITSRDVLVR